MRFYLFFLYIIFFTYNLSAQPCQLKPGEYRLGKLALNDSTSLEFYIREDSYKNRIGKLITRWVIYNAQEEIVIQDRERKGDTLYILMPVFSSYFAIAAPAGKPLPEPMRGFWVNENRTTMNRIPFSAEKVYIKPVANLEEHAFEGTWETVFSPGTAEATPAIGKFYNGHCWDRIYGTFLTETGDYRYLSGHTFYNKNGQTCMQIACFDGTHAFLFKATMREDSSIEGVFYSGMHHSETWTAKRNPKATLRDPGQIIQIIKPQQPVEFGFKSTEGKLYTSTQFKGKPMVIQLMGSWCPNCMDESVSLEKFRRRFGNDIHFVALAFEKTADTALARVRLERFRKKLGCNYPFLITGFTGKDAASKLFPMLSPIEAFPTTIYIDANGKVVYTTSGYNGPATGNAHLTWEADTEKILRSLLTR